MVKYALSWNGFVWGIVVHVFCLHLACFADVPPILLPANCPYPPPAHLLLRKSAFIEDVWDGEPAIFSDDEDCNFLGFRITANINNGECCQNEDQDHPLGNIDDDDDQEDVPLAYLRQYVQKSSQNKKKKKKKKSKNKNVFSYKKKKRTKSKKSKYRSLDNMDDSQLVPEDLSLGSRLPILPSCAAEETDCLEQNIISEMQPTPEPPILEELMPLSPKLKPEIQENITSFNKKKKREFFLSSPYKRGSNGWEDCLRPRPAQVQHYQSIVIMRKRKFSISSLLKDQEKESSKHAKLEPEDSVPSLILPTPINEPSPRPLRNKVLHNHIDENEEQELTLESLEIDDKELLTPENSCQIDDHEGTDKPLEAGVGEIVWAKLGCTRWWPAMVIWGADCGQPPARPGQTWVFWFGDHKISELPRDKLTDFVIDFNNKFSEFAGKMFKRGVVEAIKEVAVRAEVDIADNDSPRFLSWAKEGFYTNSKKGLPYAPDSTNPVPENVRKHLNRIKSQYLQALQSLEYNNILPPRFSRLEQLENKDSMLKKVREGTLKIEDVCIACDSSSVEIVEQHPLIQGGLCKQCKYDIVETMFAYGDDGTNAYCVICGQAGELLICDNNECNRCYCTGCVDVLVAPGAHKKVLATSPWLCYLCSEYNPELNGLIRKKEEWQQNVMQLFQPEKHVQLPPSMDDYKEKRAIRVLSLFDGIGTGRYVLDLLGIDVEVYYASEIDQDAINVAIVQHKTNILHLGPIEEITDAEVAKLCPIDLVIGGSPCNDLSLVNPARKGLYDPTGTGKLFFDFFRVLKAVQLANKGRHVFWLYENVASMPQEYKSTITRFLQCEPAMLDSKYFSPQNRARYFWGNIPGLYSPLQPHLVEQDITLDSVLTPCLNRKAVVEKIRTVTTRSNSLKQGKKCILPVTMNGEGDVLWVTELEQVFGFPRHYTDVGNIPLGRRQQLLGKAWSVPVIKHLFTPLRNFFKTVSSTSSSPIPVSTAIIASSNSVMS